MMPILRDQVAAIGIVLAVILWGLGQLITFYPGAQTWWYGAAAISAAAGLIGTRWEMRIYGFVLAVGMTYLACSGYVEGVNYRNRTRQGWSKRAITLAHRTSCSRAISPASVG